LTIEGGEIVVRPVGGVQRAEKRVPIETPTSEARFWQEFLGCVRSRRQPRSGITLGATVATTLQMGILAMRERRYVRYDGVSGKVM